MPCTGEEPTAENPYKQRWYFDPEGGYIIRLLRNEQGEKLYRDNATSIRKEERHYARKYACIGKETGNCDGNCSNCQRNSTARTIDLDKPLASNGESDGDAQYLDISTPDLLSEIVEKEERYEEKRNLQNAILKLPKNQQQVVILHFLQEKTQTEIATIMGKDQSSVSRQLQTAINNLIKLLSETA